MVVTQGTPESVDCRHGTWNLAETLGRRRWALVFTLATVVTGMAYSLLWAPVIRHQSAWVTPGDIWATFRGAHYVAWGGFADVYGAKTGLVSFPGMLVVLAPISALTGALGLSEGFPIGVAHPMAWLVLGPVTLGMAAVPLCGLDALAESRGVPLRQRRELMAGEAAVLWIMLALWGHPEDAVALGLVVYAIVAGGRGAWRRCGWLLGLATVMQPLTVLVLPTLLAWTPTRQRLGGLLRAVLPSVVLLSIPLAENFSDTWQALTKQPNYPTVDHPTPWVRLAPSLGHSTVAAGPGRLLAVACAVIVGLWVWRGNARGQQVDIVWACTLALASRCVFEAVMVPYYVTPAVALAVLLASDVGKARVLLTAALGVGLTVMAHTHADALRWWLEMMGLLAAVLASARWPSSVDLPRHRATGVPEVRDLLNSAGVVSSS